MCDCIFCKIANHEIPSNIVWENEDVIVFKDLNPQAPFHVLVVPKFHYSNIIDGVPSHTLASMTKAVEEVTREAGIADEGFRCIMNTGAAAGQTVDHLHMHILGGKTLGDSLLP